MPTEASEEASDAPSSDLTKIPSLRRVSRYLASLALSDRGLFHPGCMVEGRLRCLEASTTNGLAASWMAGVERVVLTCAIGHIVDLTTQGVGAEGAGRG